MNKYINELRRILNPFSRDIEPTAGDRGYCVGRVVEKGIDRANRRVTATLSTPTIDRYGEVVVRDAFAKSLPRFLDNPKFLAGHQSSTMDGSPTSIGHWIDVQIGERGLVGTAQFLPPGDELADKWWFRFEHGAQRTFSVGFIGHKAELREVEIDGVKKKVRHFVDAELLEVSAVELPANVDAVLMMLGAEASDAQQFDRMREAMEKSNEASLNKILNSILTDPLGPVTVALKNALDDWHAARGHREHEEGEPDDGKALRRSGLDQNARTTIGTALADALRRTR